MPGEPLRQGFHHQCEAEALVPGLLAAQQHQAPAVLGPFHKRGVAGRPPGAVQHPGMVEWLTGSSLFARHRHGGERGADIHQHGVTRRGKANGEGIGAEQPLAATERRHRFRVRTGRGDDRHIAAVGRLFRIGGEAADVVAPPHRQGEHPGVAPQTLESKLESLLHEPEARQIVAVPDDGRPGVPHAFGGTGPAHPTLEHLPQIGVALRQTVGVATHHVGQQQGAPHAVCLVGIEPRRGEQSRGKAA